MACNCLEGVPMFINILNQVRDEPKHSQLLTPEILKLYEFVKPHQDSHEGITCQEFQSKFAPAIDWSVRNCHIWFGSGNLTAPLSLDVYPAGIANPADTILAGCHWCSIIRLARRPLVRVG